nr:n-methyltransferase tcpn [Quercus suber]
MTADSITAKRVLSVENHAYGRRVVLTVSISKANRNASGETPRTIHSHRLLSTPRTPLSDVERERRILRPNIGTAPSDERDVEDSFKRLLIPSSQPESNVSTYQIQWQRDSIISARQTLAKWRLLNLQHYLIRDLFDDKLLDPSISLSDTHLKIADVCCDIAPLCHATTELFALDINPAQLPPAAWLPRSIHRRRFDVFDAATPSDLEGSFDIVNVQILFSFVKDEHINQVITNLSRLLKPGGYLQWTEFDGNNPITFSPDPSFKSELMPRFASDIWKLIRQPCSSWMDTLDSIMGSGELETVKCLRPNLKQGKLPFWTQEYIMVHKGICQVFLESTQDPKSREEAEAYMEMLEEVKLEMQARGTALWLPVVRVIGQK